jgi:hypothetical protein
MKYLLSLLLIFLTAATYAAVLKGKVTDTKGEPLPFASVYLKGTTKGTTTNVDGNYQFELPEGKHLVVCQYVGFQKEELEVTLGQSPLTHHFKLKPNETSLKEVVVKQGENPALAIIKKTIKKRSFYNKQLDGFRAEAYIKGNIKLDDVAKSGFIMNMLGEGKSKNKKDTNNTDDKLLEDQKGIIFLSESVSEIAYKRPDKLKTIVKSSRVSGSSQSYGLSEPLLINLYDNNVQISSQISPRGFISPIAETAMLNYKYELLSAYIEDGKLINRIKVIPRRKFEPLFSGIIEIIENEWRLHAVDLLVDKDHQLDMIDTMFIKQLFVPVKEVLMVKDQSFKVKLKLFGFGFTGNFVQTFSDYELNYDPKKYFNKFEKEYTAEALKHTAGYWDTIRPIPLDEDEKRDYVKKDSIQKVDESKKDSVVVSKNTFKSVVFRGYVKRWSKKRSLQVDPIIGLNNFNWNTAEGLNYSLAFRLRKRWNEDRSLMSKVSMRYGVSNKQFNAKIGLFYSYGKTNKSTLSLQGGRYVFQFNNEEPVDPLINSVYTLFYGRNYLKIYQAAFAQVQYNFRHVSGFQFSTLLNYQNRFSLNNTEFFSFRKNDVQFTANYPTELLQREIPNHQALLWKSKLSYQPGRKYIKYPDRIISTSSKYPTFGVGFTLAKMILGSDVDYSKWEASMTDDMNFNLLGQLNYRIKIGGFLSNQISTVIDYTHFNGNQIILASPYLNSFQLASYYANSNTERFYTTVHAEHHFYGLLTNKIPLFRRLKWYLVAASNMYYVNRNNNYIEASAGLENIGFKLFRFMRVDGVVGYSNLARPVYGVRIGVNSSVFSIGRGED